MPTEPRADSAAGGRRRDAADDVPVGGLRCHTLEGGCSDSTAERCSAWCRGRSGASAIAPDERHRIPLAMRCLLIEHPDGLVLVDTALGNKESAKFHDIYGIENQGLEGATQLEDALASAGFLPEDVRWVINTHLHFDHAGGNTTIDPTLGDDPRRHVRPTYSNATYVVQKGELEFAPAYQRADPRELSVPQFRAGCGREALAAAGGRRRGAAGGLACV